MTDVRSPLSTSRPVHPGGVVGVMHETMFGPPPTPDPADLEAEARQRHRDELRDSLDVANRFATTIGLIVLEVLAAILLLGVIRAVY